MAIACRALRGLERYMSSTLFPYHFLAGALLLMVVYWSTSLPEWVEFTP